MRRSPPASPKQPRAVRLIGNLECFVETVLSNFHLDSHDAPEHAKWDTVMRIILNPSAERPKRVMEDGVVNFVLEPRTGLAVDPTNTIIREDYDTSKKHEWSVMTCVTLLPKDGNIALFGGNGVGLLLDCRLCDMRDEQFVFKEEAMAFNDWWLRNDAAATEMQQKYKSVKLNVLREELAEHALETREYNDISVGLNAKSICGIALHPVTKNISLADRFCAIERKMAISRLLDRVLPVVIVGPHHPVREYTIAEQNEDILSYITSHPDSPKLKLLQEMFQFNLQCPLVETTISNRDTAMAVMDLTKLPDVEQRAAEKLQLMDERNKLMRFMSVLEYEQILCPALLSHDKAAIESRFIDVTNEIELKDRAFEAEYKQDAGCMLHYAKLCVDSQKNFDLLSEAVVDFRSIRERLDKGEANESDIINLNNIDIEFTNNKDIIYQAVDECKIRFIKNKILSGTLGSGFITHQVGNREVKVSIPNNMLLQYIAQAEQQLDNPNRWKNCLIQITDYLRQTNQLEKHADSGVERASHETAADHLAKKTMREFYQFVLREAQRAPLPVDWFYHMKMNNK